MEAFIDIFILATITFILEVTVLLLFFIHRRNKNKDKKKSDKPLYSAVLIVFAVILLITSLFAWILNAAIYVEPLDEELVSTVPIAQWFRGLQSTENRQTVATWALIVNLILAAALCYGIFYWGGSWLSANKITLVNDKFTIDRFKLRERKRTLAKLLGVPGGLIVLYVLIDVISWAFGYGHLKWLSAINSFFGFPGASVLVVASTIIFFCSVSQLIAHPVDIIMAAGMVAMRLWSDWFIFIIVTFPLGVFVIIISFLAALLALLVFTAIRSIPIFFDDLLFAIIGKESEFRSKVITGAYTVVCYSLVADFLISLSPYKPDDYIVLGFLSICVLAVIATFIVKSGKVLTLLKLQIDSAKYSLWRFRRKMKRTLTKEK